MARIAVAGLQHETNTFSPEPATLEDFLLGGGWPGLLSGASLLEVTAAMNLPIAGAAAALKTLGHEIVPLVWAAATPSGRVEDAAFDAICERLIAALQQAGPFDGLYLDLHGAMATRSHDDGEGELLKRLRASIGDLPIVASIDYHANVSPAMVALTDALIGYRTYPHIDMSACGARAAQLLHRRLARGKPFAVSWRQMDFLIALTSQCTLIDPAARLIQQLENIETTRGLEALTWTGGFPLADVHDCGQTVLAYGDTTEQTDAAVQALARLIEDAEMAFQPALMTAERAVQHALRQPGPVILADTQDNPGGGGSSDTTGILHALLAAQADNAVVALLHDPQAARRCHDAGPGARLHLALGGRTADGAGHQGIACEGEYQIEFLSDGNFTGTGPMWGGSPIALGPTVLLRRQGVRIIVCSAKMQAADQSIFHHVGIDPKTCHILALKSSVHFRADFQDWARAIITVASPGLVVADLTSLPYQNLRPGLRLPA